MDYAVYAALYACRDISLPAFGVKVGHSHKSVERVHGIMSPMDVEDIFFVDGLTLQDARSREEALKEKLATLLHSGGSSEFYLFNNHQWGKAYDILRDGLGSLVNHQPHANCFSPRSTSTVLADVPMPTKSKLKKNYVLAS